MPPDPDDARNGGDSEESSFDKGAGHNPPPDYEYEYPDPPPPPPDPPEDD